MVGEGVVGIGLIVGECDGAEEIFGLCDTVGETVGCGEIVGISNCNDRIRNPSNR